MKNVAFITFGCKVNQYDTQVIREDLLRDGFSEVEPEESPEIFIVNTCTVTQRAYKEARQVVAKLLRENPDAQINVTGCAAITNADVFHKLGAQVIKPYELRIGELRIDRNNLQSEGISYFKDHTRAFLKVEDGCDLDCSFCIIPKVRGMPLSKKLEDAVSEARELVANGYKEIVLAGIHLGSYENLAGLIDRLLEVDGLERLRLSSLEANELNDEIIELMASSEKFCPHLHLPLQSGDDKILRAMRRRYNVRQFLNAIDKIKNRIDEPALTTDVIVGFPGESEENFTNTMRVCEQIGFSRIHIFPYSPRRGTDADKIPQTVSTQEKRSRLNRLKKLAKGLTANYCNKFIGKEIQVLIEEQNGLFSGYSERYIKTKVDSAGFNVGDIVKVEVERVKDGYVKGKFIGKI